MRKIIFCLLFVRIIDFQAQEFKIKQGDEFETPGVVWYKENVESDSTGFYFLRNKNGLGNTYVYHKIDKSGKTIFIKETDFPTNGKVYNCNGKLLFFSFNDNSGKSLKLKNKKYLYLTEISSMTGEKVSETQQVDYVETENNNQYADIDISFSPDKNLFLVTSEIKEDKKRQSVICRLYSTNGYKRIWEKQPITVYKNSTVSSSQYCIDNQGNLCYLFDYVRSGHKDVLDNFDDVNCAMVAVSAANASVKIEEINATNKKIENIHAEIIGNKFICSGQFSDGMIDIDKNAKRGFFITYIRLTDFEVRQNFVYLDEKIEDKVINHKEKYGNDIKWTESKIFEINGSYYIVKQRIRMVVPSTIDEILIMKCNENLVLEWTKLIPKFSYAEKENAINFFKTDKLSFIYYENLKNLAAFPDVNNYDRMKCLDARYDKDPLIVASIDEAGIVTRKPLEIKEQILLENQYYKDYHGNYINSIILPVRVSSKRKRYDVLFVN